MSWLELFWYGYSATMFALLFIAVCSLFYGFYGVVRWLLS